MNPETHYLGKPAAPVGVVEKCTFCVQRVRTPPDATPRASRSARWVPESSGTCSIPRARSVRHRKQRVFILKEDLNTRPKFYYFYAT